MTAQTVTLSLISHTNVGKTTLARTLLYKDIGEVADRAHVTDISEAHELIRTPKGEVLQLYDTPGFGDTPRLWKHIERLDTPLLGFLGKVWDRFTARPLWCSQQALLNVRDHADVVLYLVNASEEPETAGYIELEMKILQWLDKPIMVLLNQMGQPKQSSVEEREVNRWRHHFRSISNDTRVIAFDAFARCWVQEDILWKEIVELLPAKQRLPMGNCIASLNERNEERFQKAMSHLGGALGKIFCDRETLPSQGFLTKLGDTLSSKESAEEQAASRLKERTEKILRNALTEIIHVYELPGEAKEKISGEASISTEKTADKSTWAIGGGVLSGALSGLAADFAAGGMTFGGGMVLGAILGASGGALLATGINTIKGKHEDYVEWSSEKADDFVRGAMLYYLAVAHYGRGRGEWRETKRPTFWRDAVTRTTTSRLHKDIETTVSRTRQTRDVNGHAICVLLSKATRDTLATLYPDTSIERR